MVLGMFIKHSSLQATNSALPPPGNKAITLSPLFHFCEQSLTVDFPFHDLLVSEHAHGKLKQNIYYF
jgi:hypothetical protein